MCNHSVVSDRTRVVEDGSGSQFDRLFSVLVEQRRRYVLYCLQGASGEAVTFDDVVAKVTRWETPSEAEPTDEHREEVEIALQHHHLPKLEHYGVVDYDPRTETIRYWNDLGDQEWLERVKAEELNRE